MNDDERVAYRKLIDSYTETHVDKQKYSFDSMMRRNITTIVEKFYEIIVKYFDDYTEEQFHERMRQTYILKDKKNDKTFKLIGFDFVGDFRKFHKIRFMGFIHSVRLIKKYFDFDEDRIYNIMLGMLEIKGWTVLEHEKESIRQTVRRLHNILYKSHDTIE